MNVLMCLFFSRLLTLRLEYLLVCTTTINTYSIIYIFFKMGLSHKRLQYYICQTRNGFIIKIGGIRARGGGTVNLDRRRPRAFGQAAPHQRRVLQPGLSVPAPVSLCEASVRSHVHQYGEGYAAQARVKLTPYILMFYSTRA